MAPSRGKGKTTATGPKSTPVRATRSTRKSKDATPDVYQEMLAEAARRSPEAEDSNRPLKRRRVATSVNIPANEAGSNPQAPQPASTPQSSPSDVTKAKRPTKPLQTIEASSDSVSDDESDLGFEDVDLEAPATPSRSAGAEDDGIGDVSISVGPSAVPKAAVQNRRKPTSNADKALRLLVHKAHLLCLLGHCMYVNTWCNDINVQRHLHPLLSKKTLTYLQDNDEYSQFQRDRNFRDGLEQAMEVFRAHFTVNASGMRQATSNVDSDEASPGQDVDPTSRRDLITAAREMEGSQDTGNQLFCALLRSAGVDARLVCSLQTLPLRGGQAKQPTPRKPAKTIIHALPPYGDQATSDSNTEDNAVKTSSTIGKVPSARRRLGQPSFKAESPTPTRAPPRKKKPVRKLDYPVFWVEVFNTAHQKWTVVDPLITHTIGKPSKFEPPSSYALNQLSYVVAFEEDGVVRDVTRRYAKAYNAKTRRNRVESTENGGGWLKKALRLFRRRGGPSDRDQTEDAELNQREVREGLPNNVQDFKDHPVYALERHLKRHEIIEPKREVGKVNAGTAAKPRMEPVYRRSDVLTCRSSDKWYRLGRVIQEGLAPIKHVPARSSRRRRSMSPDTEGEGAAGAGLTALYAQYQTEVYVAPPVVKGKVPRNAFGNLDIYVSSMVPPGGTHIRHRLTQQAAKILRVDFADAVTGFQFKGRHGTAIVQGAVVPTQYAEAVEAVIDGLLNEQLEEESLARSTAALKMWKRFLTGLRIKERVSAYGTDGAVEEDMRGEIDRQVEEQEEIGMAGGFVADSGEEPAMPTAGKFSLVEMARVERQAHGKKGKGKARKEESESEEEAEFSGAEGEEEDVGLSRRRSKRVRRTIVREEDDEGEAGDGTAGIPGMRDTGDYNDMNYEGGGGFLPEQEDRPPQGGGFVLEEGEDPGAGGFIPEVGGEEVGGGFLPEEDSGVSNNGDAGIEAYLGGGGGFLPEDEGQVPHPDASQPTQEEVTLPSRASEDVAMAHADGVFGAGLNDDAHDPVAAEEAHIAPIDVESKDTIPLGNRNDDNYNSPPATDEALSMHGALPNGPGKEQSERDRAADSKGDRCGGEEEERDSDMGSMISHDPEDEDAEPDWLESD